MSTLKFAVALIAVFALLIAVSFAYSLLVSGDLSQVTDKVQSMPVLYRAAGWTRTATRPTITTTIGGALGVFIMCAIGLGKLR